MSNFTQSKELLNFEEDYLITDSTLPNWLVSLLCPAVTTSSFTYHLVTYDNLISARKKLIKFITNPTTNTTSEDNSTIGKYLDLILSSIVACNEGKLVWLYH